MEKLADSLIKTFGWNAYTEDTRNQALTIAFNYLLEGTYSLFDLYLNSDKEFDKLNYEKLYDEQSYCNYIISYDGEYYRLKAPKDSYKRACIDMRECILTKVKPVTKTYIEFEPE